MRQNETRLASLKPSKLSGEEFQEERIIRAGIIYQARAWEMERGERY